MILLNVKQRFNMENIQYFYSRIFESDFLLYLSAFLLSCSVICLFCVLRNVSISYPDFVDEKEFIEKSKSDDAFSPSALPVFQYERSIRQDLRSLPSKKEKEDSIESTFRNISNRYSIDSPSNGTGDSCIDSEEHSMTSEDVGSDDISSDGFTYDFDKDSLIRESASNPRLLVGWQINVKGRGVGVILDMKKSLGRSTKFFVQFGNGSLKLLSLKRGSMKGNVPFYLISRVSS